MIPKFRNVAVVVLITVFCGLVTSEPVNKPAVKLTKKHWWCDSSSPSGRKWANDWDKVMHFSCPRGQCKGFLLLP